MSLFGVEAPRIQAVEQFSNLPYATGSHLLSGGRSPLKPGSSQAIKQQRAAIIFNEIVETIIDQVPDDDFRPEVETLSDGTGIVVCDIVRPRKTFEDGRDYEMVVSAASLATDVQNTMLRAISIAQWSPDGESDGRFWYTTRHNYPGVERYYLPISSGGKTVAEQRQFAVRELEMSTPVPMGRNPLRRLGRSIMTLHPEFNLPV